MNEAVAKRMTARAAYGRLWRDWLKPHWPKMLVSVLLMALVAVASAGYAKFMEWVIAGLADPGSGVKWWGPLGIIALTTTRAVGSYVNQRVQNRVLSTVQADMQKQMFDRLITMDLAHLLAESPAALATRFSADIELIRNATILVFGSVRSVLTLVAVIAVVLSIDWVMALTLLGVFALAFGPIGFMGAKIRKISVHTQKEISHMTEAVNEGLSGIRIVRTYQLEDWVRRSSSAVFDRLLDLRISLVKWQSMLTPMVEILAGLSIAVLLFLVSWRISIGAIDLAGFIGLLSALGVATNPARKLASAYAIGLQGMAALERVYELYDVENTILDGDFTLPEGEKVKGDIRFEQVDFIYPDGFHALRDVNLTIEQGKTVAFVGRSGAGKSTVFNLLPRLFDATSGQVEIDGRPIMEFSLSCLREQISVVGQDSVLLTGTVLDNIGFGRASASREAIIAAAKAAAAHEFIEALPEGYDTHIDPAKNAFSGGERQRLSIARAIVRDAPILLLDEPTSALDAESENTIRTALDELSQNRTTLVIAHRLATILDADMIVVMDQGRIVDQGTHDELLARGGIYAELFSLQFDQSAGSGRRGRSRSFSSPRRNRGIVERMARFIGFGGSDNG